MAGPQFAAWTVCAVQQQLNTELLSGDCQDSSSQDASDKDFFISVDTRKVTDATTGVAICILLKPVMILCLIQNFRGF